MKLLTTLYLGFILTFCSEPMSLLQKIQASGELWVATRNSPTTYYEGPQGEPRGLEYALTKRFADALGVELKLVTPANFADILPMVMDNEVHFAAAGLTITETRQMQVRFTPPYQHITQQLVHHRNQANPPQALNELTPEHRLNVIAGSSQVDFLTRLKSAYPQLYWETVPETEPIELLEQIWLKERQYALLDAHEVAHIRHVYPELQVGFELTERQSLAWAFPRFTQDDSLYLAAVEFLQQLHDSGELAQLLERYYGYIDIEANRFDYVDSRLFLRHIEERLPAYRQLFEQTAARYGVDWRLIAAIGYQESRWEPDAVSKTGVRGLMMLTLATAEEMGVEDREDPAQSISGGTRYLLNIKNRLHRDIGEPDRTWFALAAYNVGLGHLWDAQKLTRQLGGNPYHWVDVKRRLPLLTKRKWYRKTRYGYARGHEPVHFVKNVRRFYNLLAKRYNQQGLNIENRPATEDLPLNLHPDGVNMPLY